jgi:hypothetical protein
MKKQNHTFIHEVGNTRLEDMRQFIVDHDITEVPSTVYHLVETLWPELLPKVKPPRELMH